MKTLLAAKTTRVNHFAGLLFLALASVVSFNHAKADPIAEALSPYPQNTQDLASCLLSVEMIKSEARIVGHKDAKTLELTADLAQFFIDKALSLEARAASIDMDDAELSEHWQSIRENSKNPDLLNKMVGILQAAGHSPELCIGLPDLVNQKELEESLDKSALQQLNGIAADNSCLIGGGEATLPVHKQASIVWTGAELLLWGGKVGDSLSQAGLIYTPSTDSWAIMPQSGDIPSARWAANSVWTGSNMIVYGGSDAPFSLGTRLYNGAKYNLATGTWTAISSTNAPENSGAKGVLLGSIWVLWGGSLDTGARYNISNDSWEAIGNGPESRTGFTLNATQNYQILMYGGRKYDGTNGTFEFKNDIWLYSLNTNSWAQKASAPNHSDYPPRTDHTAVWSGTDLLVFGGLTTGFDNIQNGVKYNLGSNSWTTLSASFQPSRRNSHGAAWTGSEMIIWGGVDSFVMRGGGIYKPSSNSWRSISLTDASPLYSFYSTWTGSEYLVFANDTSGNLKAGEIYNYAGDTWREMSTQLSGSSPEVQALWDFDAFSPSGIGSPNGKRVVDACGNRDAKLITPNSPQASVTGLQLNTTAVSFDVGSDRIRFLRKDDFDDHDPAKSGPAFDFDYDESMTLEVMIKVPNGYTSTGSIVAKDVGSNERSWWFRVINGVLQGLISDGPNSSIVMGNTSINDGQWHQVALVRDALLKTLSVYVDYKLDTSVSDITLGGSVTADSTQVSIAAFNAGTRQLTGDIDFVRITKGVVPISQMHLYDSLVDIALDLSDGGSSVEANAVVQYTLTVSNVGPAAATNMNVIQNFPADFSSVVWTCVSSVDASCTAAGSGDIVETTSIPAGGNVTFTIDATLSATPGSVISTSASATNMGSEIELNTSNNSVSSVIYPDEVFANGFENP